MASDPKPVKCPKCGTDVMVTGFTLRSEVTVSYMRFNGMRPVEIASSVLAADRAECLCCGARLAVTPVELMRAA